MTRLTPGDVACWVLKSAVPPESLAPAWPPGGARTLDRCLRPSYRLGLMRPGAPCLLWVSGRDRSGVHALGELVDLPHVGAAGPEVAVRWLRLDRHLPRAELVGDPVFAEAEVVRMPAGSNPSWLSAAQFAAVLEMRPRRAGTMDGCVATGSSGEPSAGS